MNTATLTPDPVQLVIFGLTGDLARKKLLPALYQLAKDHLLADATRIIGVSRRDVSAREVLAFMHADSAYEPAVLRRLEAAIDMFQMDLADPDGYRHLKDYLDTKETKLGICAGRLFYLSMPPQVFGPVIDLLGASGMSDGCAHGDRLQSRLLIEKPFGSDLASAEELVVRIAKQFEQEQIYRIDHYVAKEASQNILAFRFHNPMFQAAWDSQSIDRIVITAAETIGIEGRAAFYEQTGALRDFLQNHLLQLLALVAMEPPADADPDTLHAEKLKLLKAIPEISPDKVATQTVRGQYETYRTEAANPASVVETFAAVRLHIDTPRWQGVPVILQAGKALDQKTTHIAFRFKDQSDDLSARNELIIHIEPNEGIGLGIMVKQPGLDNQLIPAEMAFHYPPTTDVRHPDAYERVLFDAMRGDRTLFTTSAETIECWRILEPILQEWAKTGEGLITYKPGTPAAELSKSLYKYLHSL